MKVSEILIKAAEGLRTKGFTKFIRHDYTTGSMCSLGAIEHGISTIEPDLTYSMVNDGHPAVQAFAQHVPPSIYYCDPKHNPLSHSIADWNNANERTAEEVIATFLAAAACEAHKEAAIVP